MTRSSLAILMVLALLSLTTIQANTVRSNLRRRLEESMAPTDGATQAPTEGETMAPTEGETMAATEGETVAATEGETVAATDSPSTESPSTESPSTESPSTESPFTESPSTESPSTESPSTESPSDAASTESPSTEAPSDMKKSLESEAPSKAMTDAPSAEDTEMDVFTDDPAPEWITQAPMDVFTDDPAPEWITQAPEIPEDDEDDQGEDAVPTAAPVKGKPAEKPNDVLTGDERAGDIAMTDGDSIFEINSVITIKYFDGQGGEMDYEKLTVFNERFEQLEAAEIIEDRTVGDYFAMFKMKDVEQDWDPESNTLTIYFTSHVELEEGVSDPQTPHKIARVMTKADYKEHIHTLIEYGHAGINKFVFTCTGTGARRVR